MKITINTDVLKKEHLTMGEYLVLLLGFYDVDYQQCCSSLSKKGIVSPNVFDKSSVVLSDNSKNLVAKLLMESDDKIVNSGIDFMDLAAKLQAIYPSGMKPGSSYTWRGRTEDIAQKLRTLVVVHNFSFTEEEAIRATEQYVKSFEKCPKYMRLLKYFILRTTKEDGQKEVASMFMTIIENIRL